MTLVDMALPHVPGQSTQDVAASDVVEIDKHFGVRLRQLRRLRQLSQVELGAMLGITFQQVQKYERGANRLTASRLVQICRLLDAPPSWFYEGLSETAVAAPLVFVEGTNDLVVAWAALTPVNRGLILNLIRALPQKAA